MTIHFVCRGNTYRSRLAETYLNSKNLQDIKAISSGVEAGHNISGSITWYAQRIIQKNNLVNFEKPMWQKTTRELLGKGDFTVFMNTDVYDFCVFNLGFTGKNFEVWKINDLNINEKTEDERIKITEETYEEIKKKVDELIIHI